MSKKARTLRERPEKMPKTKELMAKNVKPGALVILRGGLGLIEVATNEKTKGGGRRLAEAAVLRQGNRRKRRPVRRSAIFAPNTKIEVVA